jgi:hypothetical protein
MAKKARKAKAARKKIGKKKPPRKKASAKKAAPVKKAKKAAKKTPVRKAVAPAADGFGPAALAPAGAPKPAPADDEAKLLAVGKYVDAYMNEQHQGWSDDDKVVDFKYTSTTIAGVLGIVKANLEKNKPQSYTFTITKKLREKCTSSDETVGDMKIDIDDSTKKA